MKKEFIFDFPELTAEEIIKNCDNKGRGGKIIWSEWMLDEDFYKKEKTRSGKKKLVIDLIGKGKTFDECKKLVEESGGEMMNFAEIIYFLVEYEKQTGKRLLENEWTFTSSRDSVGGLVYVGRFDSGGSVVDWWGPRFTDSDVGVCFSRS